MGKLYSSQQKIIHSTSNPYLISGYPEKIHKKNVKMNNSNNSVLYHPVTVFLTVYNLKPKLVKTWISNKYELKVV